MINNSVSVSTKTSIATVNISSATALSTAFNIKALEYYNGYWWIVGNSSDLHTLYWAYSTNGSSWTVKSMTRSEYDFPVSCAGIAGTGTNQLYIGMKGSSTISIMRITDPLTSTAWNYWGTGTDYNDISGKNGNLWIVTNTAKRTEIVLASTPAEKAYYTHGSISKTYTKCCAYGNYAVAISSDGHYTYKPTFDNPYVSGEFQAVSGLTCVDVAAMGDYLVIVGKKSDGMYIAYGKGTPGSINFSTRKIVASSSATPIGLAYANGLYVFGYTVSNKLRLALLSKIDGDVVDISMDALGNYNTFLLGSNGSNIELASASGSASLATTKIG